MPIIVGNTTSNSAITSTSLTEMSPQSYLVTNALRNTMRPTLLLPFAQSGAVDPRITFTRNGQATYFNSAGVLTTATNNVPRIDYNPSTLACNGLLMEQSSVNLLLQSTFQSGWSGGNATLTANQLLSPDGTVNAAKFVENTAASAYHYTSQTIAKAASALVYTFSVFLKASGNRQVTLRLSDGTNGAVVTCDPVAGTIATAGVYGTFTSASGTIQTIGNGWYRFSLTTTSSTATTILPGLESVSAGTNVYTGDGASGFYCFGAQLEQLAFPTSYIATTGATANRIQELAKIPLSSWYNASAFSLLIEAQKNTSADTGYSSPVELNDGTGNHRSQFYVGPSTAALHFAATYGGGDVTTGTYTLSTPYKAAGSMTGTSTTTGTIAASLNGATAVTGTTTNLDSALYTNMNIGFLGTGNNLLNGWIQRIAYYPVAFSNTQLQAMSS
jgi:hypothetical protein